MRRAVLHLECRTLALGQLGYLNVFPHNDIAMRNQRYTQPVHGAPLSDQSMARMAQCCKHTVSYETNQASIDRFQSCGRAQNLLS